MQASYSQPFRSLYLTSTMRSEARFDYCSSLSLAKSEAACRKQEISFRNSLHWLVRGFFWIPFTGDLFVSSCRHRSNQWTLHHFNELVCWYISTHLLNLFQTELSRQYWSCFHSIRYGISPYSAYFIPSFTSVRMSTLRALLTSSEMHWDQST